MPRAAGHASSIVAVAYDGSESSQLAVRWAAEHAAAGNFSLRVIHAFVWPVFTKDLGPVKGVEGSGLRHAAEVTLAEGVELARKVSDSLDVEGVIEPGLPAKVLRDASRDARLLAVGNRGMGWLLGHLVGSVCLELAASAPCPLMVVRYEHRADQPVAAGITTALSEAVMADAAWLAASLRAPIKLVHVDTGRGSKEGEPHGRHAPFHGQELVDYAVDHVRKLAPDAEVSGVLLHGHPASKELLVAAAEADVLVLGAHRPDGGVGSTVSAALQRALCNVMVTR